MAIFISHSETETQKIAADFVASLQGGAVVTLTGQLGAGKTAFTKGMAAALGIEKEITSPTFAIMNVYEIKNSKFKTIQRLVHIDTYRLKSEEELLAIGAEEYLGADNTVTIIEWPELAKPMFKNKKIKLVELIHNPNGSRQIIISE